MQHNVAFPLPWRWKVCRRSGVNLQRSFNRSAIILRSCWWSTLVSINLNIMHWLSTQCSSAKMLYLLIFRKHGMCQDSGVARRYGRPRASGPGWHLLWAAFFWLNIYFCIFCTIIIYFCNVFYKKYFLQIFLFNVF